MTVQYLTIAMTDLTTTCTSEETRWEGRRELPVTVDIHDTAGERVFTARIDMDLTEKKK